MVAGLEANRYLSQIQGTAIRDTHIKPIACIRHAHLIGSGGSVAVSRWGHLEGERSRCANRRENGRWSCWRGLRALMPHFQCPRRDCMSVRCVNRE